MDVRKLIGLRIRRARELQGMSQGELARRLQKAKNAISSYETGTRTIKVAELPLLAQALGVSISYFFEDLSLAEEARILKASHQHIVRMLIDWLTTFEKTGEEALEIELQIVSREAGNGDIFRTIYQSQGKQIRMSKNIE